MSKKPNMTLSERAPTVGTKKAVKRDGVASYRNEEDTRESGEFDKFLYYATKVHAAISSRNMIQLLEIMTEEAKDYERLKESSYCDVAVDVPEEKKRASSSRSRRVGIKPAPAKRKPRVSR